MLLTVEGLVLSERAVSENDKFIDILTKEHGIIEISVKGAKKLLSKNSSSTQLFAYSTFCIQKKMDRYYLNSSQIIRSFYDIRMDIFKVSLASYFSELVRFTVPKEQPSVEIFRLTLNTFHFLEKGLHPISLIKSIFELRLISEIGLMPDVLCCKKCNKYEDECMYFFINQGIMMCPDCYNKSDELTNKVLKIDKNLLYYIRYILLSDLEKIFKFKISESNIKALNEFSENYVISQLERNFKTLDFYHSLEIGG